MKNRISVLFSVILGTMLIASCSSVFQPNKRVADIEVKASLSGTLAREAGTSADGSGSDTATGTVETDIPVIETTDNTSDDPYSFIDEMLVASSDYEDAFTYYQIITKLIGSPYNLTEDQACDILADKIIENSDFSTYNNYWMQIRTNFGQESEKVYPYAKQMGLIKSYYKASIKTAYLYYSFLDEAGALLSDGQLDSAALAAYFTNPDAIEKFENLSTQLTASTALPDYNFDLTTVSLKLNSVPFDQEVTFTLLINYDSEADIEPVKFEFTKFVNPGLNVFDFTPYQTTATGDDVKDDDNDEGTPVISDDPWEDYTTYYVSNSAAEDATGSEDDPMYLSAAFEQCTKSYEDTKTKYAIILKDNITLSATCTVPESAYIVITGNYGDSIKKISAGSGFNSHMFSIEDHANLGLSSVALDGTNLNCQLFYCSHFVNEGDTETNPNSLTGTLTMENCTVTNFAGTTDIGIITMATGGKMAISGCTFEYNYVHDKGTIYLNNGTLILNGSLLDSTLTSINTNSFNDYVTTNSPNEPANPCEIYLKGTGTFNETNEFVNAAIDAVHVAGWTTLTLNGTYYSGTTDTTPLRIYSTTDGSTAESENCINTITVDNVDNVSITDGGDAADDTDDATYTLSEYTPV